LACCKTIIINLLNNLLISVSTLKACAALIIVEKSTDVVCLLLVDVDKDGLLLPVSPEADDEVDGGDAVVDSDVDGGDFFPL